MDEGKDLRFAGRFLGLSPHTVRAYAKRGLLAHYKIGRRIVFREADLRAFLERRRVPAREDAGR